LDDETKSKDELELDIRSELLEELELLEADDPMLELDEM
jgi:hypothetical protein